MLFKLSIITLFFTYSFSAVAEKTPACVDKAIRIAESLDRINETQFAQSVPTAETIKVYSEASQELEAISTFTFGTGESQLLVQIKPNYYETGDCIFKSTSVLSQE